MPQPLTALQLDQISQGLRSLGEQTHQLADDLRRAKFSAFQPYQQFIESFAKDSHERAIHHEYVKERAKAMMSLSQSRHVSPFMERLKEAAGKSPLRSDPATEWIPRLHVDPCEQNAFLLKVRDPEEYEVRQRAMHERRAARLDLETTRHSTGVASEFPAGMLVKPMRFKFATRVIEQELASLGFRRVRANAAKGGVIVSKSIAPDWDLDWSVGDPDLFYYGPGSGSLTLNLKLRAGDAAKTDRDDALGQVFSIHYSSLVYGFSTAYMSFNNLNSLETMIKAHVQLYRLVAAVLEGAIAGAL